MGIVIRSLQGKAKSSLNVGSILIKGDGIFIAFHFPKLKHRDFKNMLFIVRVD